MNYAVYNEQTVMVTKITSSKPREDESYITIDPEITAKFYSGDIAPFDYRVISGKLVYYKDLATHKSARSSRLYPIPKSGTEAEFNIRQNTEDKTCKIFLNQIGKESAVDSSSVVMAACKPGDPHWPYWVRAFKISELIDRDVTITYTGTDDIEFFTKKIFKTYSHEQI
jgi:hypothetical protein